MSADWVEQCRTLDDRASGFGETRFTVMCCSGHPRGKGRLRPMGSATFGPDADAETIYSAWPSMIYREVWSDEDEKGHPLECYCWELQLGHFTKAELARLHPHIAHSHGLRSLGPVVQQEFHDGRKVFRTYTGEGDYGGQEDEEGTLEAALDWLWRNPPEIELHQYWCGDLHGQECSDAGCASEPWFRDSCWPCLTCGRTHAHSDPTCPDFRPDAYLLEVAPQHRTGRGKWWAANRCGYTSKLGLAGLYTREEAEKVARTSDRGERAVSLSDALNEHERVARWRRQPGNVWTDLGWEAP